VLLAYIAVYPIFRDRASEKASWSASCRAMETGNGIFACVPWMKMRRGGKRFMPRRVYEHPVPAACTAKTVRFFACDLKGPEDLSAAPPPDRAGYSDRTLTESGAEKLFRF
jgi:hypothetical protein